MSTYKELPSIRWLSYYNALQTVHRTIDSLLTYKDLEKIKEMTSPNLTALASDIQGNKFRGEHQITKATFNLAQLCIKFIDNLISNMHSRFPNTSLLCAFGVMSLRPICFMSEEELKDYGEEELELLIAHYGYEQTHRWTEDTEDHQITT